jgi:hypothetical protein
VGAGTVGEVSVDRVLRVAAGGGCSEGRYMARGVSADKEDVHNAIRNVDKGLFPQAFCKIIPDYLGGDDEYCNIMHAGASPESRDEEQLAGRGSSGSGCSVRRVHRRVACMLHAPQLRVRVSAASSLATAVLPLGVSVVSRRGRTGPACIRVRLER